MLTRHLVWRQSKAGLITRGTTDAVLISEVLGELDPRLIDEVRQAFAGGISEWFAPRSLAIGLADAATPVFEA